MTGKGEMRIGIDADTLELDALPDSILRHNFGYTDAGIDNLREQAKRIKQEMEE